MKAIFKQRLSFETKGKVFYVPEIRKEINAPDWIMDTSTYHIAQCAGLLSVVSLPFVPPPSVESEGGGLAFEMAEEHTLGGATGDEAAVTVEKPKRRPRAKKK